MLALPSANTTTTSKSPVYVPEALDEPLAHFPGTLTEQVVDKLDFQSPAVETRAALAVARDKFEVSVCFG